MNSQWICFKLYVILIGFLSTSTCFGGDIKYPLSDQSQCALYIQSHRYYIKCPSVGPFLQKKLDHYSLSESLELDQLVATAYQFETQVSELLDALKMLNIKSASSLDKLELQGLVVKLSGLPDELLFKSNTIPTEYYVALGLSYQLSGQPVLALETYLQGLLHNQNDVGLRLRVAAVLIELDRVEQGLEYYINLLQVSDLSEHHHSMIWYELAVILFSQRDYSYALQSLEQVFESENSKEVDFLNLNYYQMAGALYLSMADYAKAIDQYQAIYRFYQAKWLKRYPSHPLLLEAMNNIGTLYGSMGQFKKAQYYFTQAMIKVEQSVFNDHPVKSLVWNNQAANLTAQGQHKQALALYQKVLANALKEYGARHVETVLCWNNMGANAYALADFESAQQYQQLALEGFLALYDEQHPQVAYSQNNLAATFLALGEYAKAQRYYEKAAQTFSEFYGAEHVQTAIAKAGLGRVWFLMGLYEQAVAALNQALEVFDRHVGEQHMYSQTTRQYLQKANTAWLIVMDQRR